MNALPARLAARASCNRRSLMVSAGLLAMLLLLAGSTDPGTPAYADDKVTLAAPPEGPPMDPAARPIAQALYDAMGGEAGFGGVAALQFTFAFSARDTVRSSRSHWWDRRTNGYRVQTTTRDGKRIVVIFNLDSKQGTAWIDGLRQSGESADKLLQRAWAWFINDTYWLLMPAKLFDPGVHVAPDGEAAVNGAACDRLKVTFDQVGLTPGDTYWAYVDRKTHLMTRWGMVLQGDRAKGDTTETQYDWVDWKQVGPLKLAARKNAVGDPDRAAILFPDLQATDAFPAAVFADSTLVFP